MSRLHTPRPRAGLALLCLLLGASRPAAASPTEGRSFLWNQANAALSRAETPREFADAAALYQALIDTGHRSAEVYRNYGTALLLADAPAAAADAIRRAETLGGTSPGLRRNLRLALTLQTTDTPLEELAATTLEPLHWSRGPFFWHYGISLRNRALALVLGFNLLCAALFHRWRRPSDSATAAFWCILGCVSALLVSVMLGVRTHTQPHPVPSYRRQPGEATP